jgi:ABC-type nickel/cobalt efflux system permease component RcnA
MIIKFLAFIIGVPLTVFSVGFTLILIKEIAKKLKE